MDSTVKLSDIFIYLEAGSSSRNLNEGQAVLNAGHIILCGIKEKKEDCVQLYALCLKSSGLTDTPHQIFATFLLNENISIKEVTCSCKAGNSSRCKHVAALLLLCASQSILSFEELSTTDVACYWKKLKGKALETYKPQPISESECIIKSKPVRHCVDIANVDINIEQKNYILNKLCLAAPDSALSKHKKRRRQTQPLRESEQLSKDLLIEIILENAEKSQVLLDLDEVLPSKQCCRKQYSSIVESETYAIAAATIVDKLRWHKERKYRITGSRCYDLYTYGKNDWHTKSEKYFWPKGFTNKFVQHGIKTEPEARMAYINETGYNVKQTGLVVSKKHPWLGYSPDGIIIGHNNNPIKLLEIKCPFIGKTEPAIGFINSCNFLVQDGELISLKKKHKYYGQVQLGMAILNLPECEFILYSSFSKDFLNIYVKFDVDFASTMINKLQTIYFSNMLHEICVSKNQDNIS